MHVTALLLSLPVALVGIYYLVWASAAAPLGQLEGDRVNRIRVRLRRINGVVMMLMSVALYLGISRSFKLEAGQQPGLVAPLAWLSVFPLLVAMVVFAWADLRLTRKLRRAIARAAEAAARRKKARQEESALPRGKTELVILPIALCGLVWLAGCGETEVAEKAKTPAAAPPVNEVSSPPATVPMEAEPSDDRGPQTLETVQVTLGEETFTLMLANDDAERQKGLMFRKDLGKNEGMIFVFPDAQMRGFWMRNTPTPLDIIYLDEEAKVVNIEQMAAYDERSTYSAGPAKYAIELPLNTTKRLGLRTGQQVELPEKAREATE